MKRVLLTLTCLTCLFVASQMAKTDTAFSSVVNPSLPPSPWKVVAERAPIATASIAGLALIVALLSIRAQQSIARKRAAVIFSSKRRWMTNWPKPFPITKGASKL
jgi:hypothetical protein